MMLAHQDAPHASWKVCGFSVFLGRCFVAFLEDAVEVGDGGKAAVQGNVHDSTVWKGQQIVFCFFNTKVIYILPEGAADLFLEELADILGVHIVKFGNIFKK